MKFGIVSLNGSKHFTTEKEGISQFATYFVDRLAWMPTSKEHGEKKRPKLEFTCHNPGCGCN